MIAKFYPLIRTGAPRTLALLALSAIVLACSPSGTGADAHKSADVSSLFPKLDGWNAEPEPSVYDSETLYEYIDGAADLYINYDFQELAALGYDKGDDRGIVIDIYRHSTPINAFGIYSQERPSKGNFIEVGTQGYQDTGILNFVLGDYYVKLSGYYLGDDDEEMLRSVAEGVAARLEGVPGFPPVIGAFPDSGKVPNSERYIAINFMGHGFLNSAYVAEYVSGETELNLFILEADDAAGAQKMVDGYLALAEKKGEEVVTEGGLHRFMDPYQKSRGRVNLASKGNYVWGLMTDEVALSKFYLEGVERGLKDAGLLGTVEK